MFTTPFAITYSAHAQRGIIDVNGNKVDIRDLSGVIVRPLGRWWPSSEFDHQNQVFIYHESNAAWLGLISNLSCPVINRYAPNWWLNDPNYLFAIRNQLASYLDMEIPSTALLSLFVLNKDSYSNMSLDGIIHRIHFVARNIIQSESDNTTEFLDSYLSQVFKWQHKAGIIFGRLDFYKPKNAEPQLLYVEPCPTIDGEPARVVEQITKCMQELFI